jgi:DHA3 family macrolide efflux protein-like MFS transporter
VLRKVNLRGMGVFPIVWAGQMISLVGSGLTSFALGVWLFERTGSITQFTLVGLFAVLPRVLLSPLAGALVDRWDRRRMMILADAGAGLATLAIALLLLAGRLDVWHIYLAVGFSAASGTAQWPAYAAATTMLVSRENLGRANGMVQLGQAVSEILAPALAGVLLLTVGLGGIILIDFVTFLVAIGTLLPIRFPPARAPAASVKQQETLWREMAHGWSAIRVRPGLAGLLVFLAAVNFLWGMVGALIAPMILGFTSSDVLGMLVSIAGVGMLAGSLIMSVWGGPRRRIHGVLGFELLSGLCFLLMGLRPSFWPIAGGVFGAHLTIAFVYGSNQAIWQTKVPAGIQGRVFATQQMVARSASPLAYLLAGPLAERLFEPLLAPGGTLATSVGLVVGVGPGRGIGLLFMVMGVIKVIVSSAGYLHPRIRLVEDELPDALMKEPGAMEP